MKEQICKRLQDVEKKLNASSNQMNQLSKMLEEASVNHQRLLGERAGYLKIIEMLDSTTKEGECDENKD